MFFFYQLDQDTIEAPGLVIRNTDKGLIQIAHSSSSEHHRLGTITFLQLAPGASEVFWKYVARLYPGWQVELDEYNLEFIKGDWMRCRAQSAPLVFFISGKQVDSFSQFKVGEKFTCFAK